MKTLRIMLMAVSIHAVILVGALGAQVPSVTGTIKRVTVYRGQALVTRSIESDLPADCSELVVQGLPENVIPESIYAQAADGTKVLSVRYRQQAVAEDTREEVRKLDQEIESAQRDLRHAESELEHVQTQWQMFERLKDFTVAAVGSDLNRGLLTYDPIEGLTALIEEKGVEYLEHRWKLEDTISELKETLDLYDRQRRELTAGRARTEREVVIFLSQDARRHVSLELNYLVNGATWQQQYNLRAAPNESTVLIEYNAVVNQTSGEDWNGVALSLSTAEPSMVAAAPILDPMLVALSPQMPAQQAAPRQAQVGMDRMRLFQQSRKDYVKEGFAANVKLNELAIENQAFVFNAGQQEVEQYQQQMAEVMRIEGVSVTYELPGRLTLPSRSDQQLVTVAAIKSKADFRLVATPLLTDYVYLQAELSNDGDTILLPGQAGMFRNGEFVGRSTVPQVAMGEKFTAGFGIDPQVRVRHELEEKKTRIQGGNRIDSYHYRITLSSYKDAPVGLRLLDRLPHAEDPSIKIELEETSPDLSADAEYLEVARKKGILRWDLTLPPQSIDRSATVVNYHYTMEYDRNMQIQPRRAAQ